MPHPPPAPPPARGQALLDANDSGLLHSFFDQMDGDDFSYDFGSGDLGREGEGLGPWESLPPTYIGSTTSLSQPGLLSSGHSRREFESLLDFDFDSPSTFTGSFDPPSSTAPEILAAASALTQTNSFSLQKSLRPNDFHGPTTKDDAPKSSNLDSQTFSPAREMLRCDGHALYNENSCQNLEIMPPGSYMSKSSAVVAVSLPVIMSQARYDGVTQSAEVSISTPDGRLEPQSILPNRNGNLGLWVWQQLWCFWIRPTARPEDWRTDTKNSAGYFGEFRTSN